MRKQKRNLNLTPPCIKSKFALIALHKGMAGAGLKAEMNFIAAL